MRFQSNAKKRAQPLKRRRYAAKNWRAPEEVVMNTNLFRTIVIASVVVLYMSAAVVQAAL